MNRTRMQELALRFREPLTWVGAFAAVAACILAAVFLWRGAVEKAAVFAVIGLIPASVNNRFMDEIRKDMEAEIARLKKDLEDGP